jgi:hypothetical protein
MRIKNLILTFAFSGVAISVCKEESEAEFFISRNDELDFSMRT